MDLENKIIGLIAGNGKLPFIFAKEAKAQGYYVVAVGIKGDTSPALKNIVDRIDIIKAGELAQLFSYLRSNNVKKAVMAGQVDPDNLFNKNVKFDDDFTALFNSMKDRKADTIFSAIAEKLRGNGIELLDSTSIMKNYLAEKGTLTKRNPTEEELLDIEFGQDIAKKMGDIDIGQTVVVLRKAIVAIEAMEGTNQAILRGGKIARSGTVVVKMSKPNQDLRFDVPTIGPNTIKNMIKVRAKCLAIEAGKTLVVDLPTCLKLANKADICIVGA